MSLASLIRGKSEPARFATVTPATDATLEGDKLRTVATVATVNVAYPPETISATASRWWLLHYPDRNPVEVASFPDATHAEILERHPETIASEPRPSAQTKSKLSCQSCEHRLPSGACGDPVAAGLSDDEGASPTTIPVDLEDLIRRAGAYWEYSPEDYDLIRETARRDPEGLRLALAVSPVTFKKGEKTRLLTSSRAYCSRTIKY